MPKSTTLGYFPVPLAGAFCTAGLGRALFFAPLVRAAPFSALGAGVTLATGAGGSGATGRSTTGAGGDFAGAAALSSCFGPGPNRKNAPNAAAVPAASTAATSQRRPERCCTGAKVRLSGSPVVPLLLSCGGA